MALQILQQNDTFYVTGNLNTTTARAFIIHFEHLIKTVSEVTINIDKVKVIDFSGVAAFKTLFATALRDDKLLHIIGNGFKDIYDELNHNYHFAA